ncbi:MAG: hypothetical protein ACON4O_00460 [Lentimonas sp.]
MELASHLVDFGMVVLLWLVQFVIYPSFLRIDSEKLVDWHQSYTFRVSFVIIPMMFGQMGLWVYHAVQNTSLPNITGLTLVSICWILTFCVSVPLHNRISKGEGSDAVLRALIDTNWYRTVCWSAIFIVGLLAF